MEDENYMKRALFLADEAAARDEVPVGALIVQGDRIVAEAHEKGYAVTMFGRKRYIPELKSSNFNIRQGAERMALNTPIQGTAADLIKLAMIKVDAALQEKFPETEIIDIKQENPVKFIK